MDMQNDGMRMQVVGEEQAAMSEHVTKCKEAMWGHFDGIFCVQPFLIRGGVKGLSNAPHGLESDKPDRPQRLRSGSSVP
ncbi:hypothetical protein E2C01_036028 [Portunus trituberculatus]|uniref:Uncharacterized protein n=1 Tax=Portunus trituberculatus TaxID=210409 RepID=A0A5B7FA33_PORTR|nr:hypothetical protein [Portunus trituberculatus]